jgi:sortase A
VRRPLLWLERLLFAIAALGLGWYSATQLMAAREQAVLAESLAQSSAATPAPAAATRPAAPRRLVARIDVPRLHLSTFAREGVDARTLRGSAGHVPGTAWPGPSGNAAFAAHRDTFFRPLRGVRTGDEILVTTTAGRFRYVVSAIRIVEPTDVAVLDPTADPTLTLITCYPFTYIGSAPHRFIVHARLAPRLEE